MKTIQAFVLVAAVTLVATPIWPAQPTQPQAGCLAVDIEKAASLQA